ncbi:hypothetical protein [Halovivax gelatinilyticus]|uniref:hypothetical protein n=1 Tax=Halovivax gelatinilyticus TaxID=2961597 RepID=UPI0020CA7C2D|nr:hypothetical protein [Halovivax gelatinilyticus]
MEMVDRRDVLKSAGMLGLGTGLLPTKTAGSDSRTHAKSQSDVNRIASSMMVDNVPWTSGKDYMLGSGLYWHWSEHTGQGWMHSISLLSFANTYYRDHGGSAREINSQQYEFLPNQSGVQILPYTEDDAFGVYPSGDGGLLPDWVEVYVINGLTNFTPGGWILSSAEAMDSLRAPDGFDLGGGGFSFTYTSSWYTRDRKATANFHQVLVKSGPYMSPNIHCRSSISTYRNLGQGRTWHDIEFDTSFNGSDPPDCPPTDPYCPTSEDELTGHPDTMSSEVLRRFGITEVEDNVYRVIEGERVPVTHVLTNNPFFASATNNKSR